MTTHELDEALDALQENGKEIQQLVGLEVNYHDHATGKTRIAKHGGLVLDIVIPCYECKKDVTVSVSSGLHNGAFCYVMDEETGAYIANLRDQVALCDDCGK